ncbi:hypothetical protein DFH08DRAFT_421717 [Mycena albidolilacea]|uniref:Uncharacterized protein n=1 Tax=Mycena albidolilacea TaxID=1033008 RepID=A0AAD6ZC18_9AGAR|nr:hypothetical protein DFH08DRAFT_421717 [Mycena albidolilacea]
MHWSLPSPLPKRRVPSPEILLLRTAQRRRTLHPRLIRVPRRPSPITSTSRTFSVPPPSVIPSSSSFVVGCDAERMRSGTYRSSRGGGSVQITSCSTRRGRDGYGRGCGHAPASTRFRCGYWVRERKSLAARRTGGPGRSIHTLRLSVPLRLQLQYTAPSPHAALHFFSYSDVAGHSIRPLPQPLIGCTTSTSSPLCFPLQCCAFLTPGASSPLLPIRRREYQSISASGVPRARSPTRNPFASAAAVAASFPQGKAPSAGGKRRSA